MKIVVTGSLGNISKPLAETLVQNGHSVTVVSSNPDKQQAIEALGATAAIGTMQDVDFLTQTFRGADIVYLMEAIGSGSFFNHNVDFIAANTQIGENYKQAVEASGVKQIIHLSSIGAHMRDGNGILAFHYNVEQLLQQLPAQVKIKFMRPVGFYYNMFAFIPTIKNTGKIIQNYGGDEREPWVAPVDIAVAIAEEITRPFNGREVRYIASDEVAPNEVASALGMAIDKPVEWVAIPDQQMLDGMIAAGMNPVTAAGVVEMNAARRNDTLYADYMRNRPVLGKVKLADFAKDFAAVYNQTEKA